MPVLHVLAAVTSMSLGSMQDTPAAGQQRGRLVEELRIGGALGDGYPLTFVMDLATDSSGYIYVAQPLDHGIAVFDPAGRFLRIIGGKGQGPGEFERVDNIGLLGDTVWATDQRLQRLSLFFRDGRLLSTMRLTVPGRGLGTVPRAVLPDDLAVGQVAVSSVDLLMNEHPSTPLVLFDRSGRTVRALARLDLSHEIFAVRLAKSVLTTVQPFRDSPLWAVPSNGRSITLVRRPASPDGRGATFSVTKFLHTGDTVFSTEYAYTPTEISRRQLDSVIRTTVERSSSRSPEAAPLIREALFIPKYYPPVSSLFVGRDGAIWLRRESSDTVEDEWLVIGPDGVPVWTVLVPAMAQLQEAAGGTVWGVVHDELDVPYVVRYRIEAIRRPD